MTEMSKIPRTHLIRQLNQLEPGDMGYVSANAVTAKLDGSAYLHSAALISPERGSGDVFVRLTKAGLWELHLEPSDGFRVQDKLPGTAFQIKVDTIIV